MELREELKKQGFLGIASMILTTLGAAGFFGITYSSLLGNLTLDLIALVLLLLLLASSIITFISRRQLAELKNELARSEEGLSDEELIDQTKKLAESISGFLGNKKIEEKYLIPRSPMTINNPENIRKQWADEVNKRSVFEEEVVKDFNEKYLGDLVRIREEFKKREITNNNLEAVLWSADYHWTQNIPVNLYEMANKL